MLKRPIKIYLIFSLFSPAEERFFLLFHIIWPNRTDTVFQGNLIFCTNELPYVINVYSSEKVTGYLIAAVFRPGLHPSMLNAAELTIFLCVFWRKTQSKRLSVIPKQRDWKAHDLLNLTVRQQLSVWVIMHMGNEVVYFNRVHNFEVMDYEMYFSLVFKLL